MIGFKPWIYGVVSDHSTKQCLSLYDVYRIISSYSAIQIRLLGQRRQPCKLFVDGVG